MDVSLRERRARRSSSSAGSSTAAGLARAAAPSSVEHEPKSPGSPRSEAAGRVPHADDVGSPRCAPQAHRLQPIAHRHAGSTCPSEAEASSAATRQNLAGRRAMVPATPRKEGVRAPPQAAASAPPWETARAMARGFAGDLSPGQGAGRRQRRRRSAARIGLSTGSAGAHDGLLRELGLRPQGATRQARSSCRHATDRAPARRGDTTGLLRELRTATPRGNVVDPWKPPSDRERERTG